MDFFEGQGFRIPERKGIPDVLQEVTSYKDQAVSLIWGGSQFLLPLASCLPLGCCVQLSSCAVHSGRG